MGPEIRKIQTARLARALEESGLRPGAAHDCAYLPGREARDLFVLPTPLVPGLYQSLMDLNFRRMGPLFYRPECTGCRECRSIRVPVEAFRPSRAQRRCLRRNADMTLALERPVPSAEKHDLYRRYLDARHDGQMTGSAEEFEGFLYSSPLLTLEAVYRVEGRLAAVGIVDVEPEAWSLVYCFFDPDLAARSPGVLHILRMIEACRERAIPHLYLGYYVADAPTMSYKATFRPCEILEGGRWQSR